MPPTCPNCGQQSAYGQILTRDGFVFHFLGRVEWEGILLRTTKCEAAFLYALAHANGRTLNREAIRRAIESQGKTDVLSVISHRVRKEIARIGGPNVVESIQSCGYRWREMPSNTRLHQLSAQIKAHPSHQIASS